MIFFFFFEKETFCETYPQVTGKQVNCTPGAQMKPRSERM
jgi:hypothetical protein